MKRCHRCRKAMESALAHCEPCLVFERARMHGLRLEAAAQGLCIMCRKFDVRPAGKICESCYQTSVYWDTRRVAEARASGNCYRCKHRRTTPNKKTCVWCRRKLRAYNKSRAKAERLAAKTDTKDRIVDVLQLVHSADLETLATETAISTRTLLRYLPELVSVGMVSRCDVETEHSTAAIYTLREVSNV